MKCNTVMRLCEVLDAIDQFDANRDPQGREVKVKVIVHISDADWEDEMNAPDDVEPDEPMNEVAEETNKEPPDGSTDSQ